MFLPRFLSRTFGAVCLLWLLALTVSVSYAAPGVTVSQSGGTTLVTEGGATDTYTIVLTEIPSGNVTITLTPDAQVSLSAATLTFTTVTWLNPQIVTVTAVNDAIDELSPHTGLITHSASGGGYTGVTIASVSADVTDNDTAGVTIVQSGGTTAVTEGTGNDTYTVVLTSQPTADVTLTPTTDAQFTLDVTTLTFTALNWAAQQTVTVTAVNDFIDETSPYIGSIGYTPVGGGYNGVSISSVGVNVVDDDVKGVTIVQSGGTTVVTEGTGNDTYTVVLDSEPTADVTIALGSNAQFTRSPAPLIFTALNWDTPQTVTVTAVDDDIDETSPFTGSISHSASGGGYTGMSIPNVSVDVIDNDVAGVTIVEIGGTTVVTEGGATDSYTVVLDTQPSASVTITLTTDTQFTPSALILTFTTVNWATPQTVIVTAVNDSITEASPYTGSISHSASGGGYTGMSIPNVSVDVIDNDVAGVTIVEIGGTTAVTEGGATDSYTVVLDTQPSASVTVTLTPDAQVSLSAPTLTFTTVNWATAQSVTVTAVNDAVDEASPHTGTITHSASGGGYTGVTIADVNAQVTDNDTRGVTIVQSGGTTTVAEGGVTDTYTVVLTSQPTGAVLITITPDAQVTTSPISLSFTTLNWATPQGVTVSAVNDAIDEANTHPGVISHSAVGGDYTGVTIANVTATVTDNDTAGVTIVQSGGTTTVIEAGATDSYTVVLNTQPTADVIITLTPDAQQTVSPTTLTFTATDWNVTQTVTVTAVDDFIDEASPHSGSIAHSAAGGGYTGVTIASVSVSVTDNDTAGVTVSDTAVDIAEGGVTDTYTLVLTSQPTANVTITISYGTQVTTSPVTTVTFTAVNWATSQTVTVTAVDDFIDETTPHSGGPITHAALGGGYTGVSIASVSTSITDNDTTGVTIVESGGTTDVTEGGATNTYTVVLDTQPTSSVTITLTGTEVTTSPTSLIFTTGNWATPQTVTVTAINDPVSEGDHLGSVSHVASNGGYTGVIIPDVTVNITDNDTKGVSIVESGGSTDVTEGGATDTFTVVLDTKPTGSVTLTLTNSEVTTSPAATLTFNNGNWNTPQTVTVTAINDAIDEASPHAGSISFTPSGGGYGSVVVAPVAVNITDNDTRGVTIAQSGGTTTVTEGGATDSYTVVLDTQPTANVTIVLNGTQVTPSPAPLIFTAVNWATPQTVTVTAINDAIVEGTHGGSVSHTATGGDYTGVIIANVSVTITDNDLGALIISPLTADVTEDGVTDGYTVMLGAQPSGNVTVTITPDTEVTTSPPTLTFTVGNWDTPQPVTVTAVNDAIVEGTHTGSITHSASGGGYSAVTGAAVVVSIADNDAGGATITQTGGTTQVAEANETSDTYTLVLTAQPKNTVTVTVTAGANTTVNPLTLTFTTTNWNVAQMVTVTAVENFIDEGISYTNTLTHSAGGGGYTGAILPSLVVTIANNDTAGLVGISLLPLGNAVTEGGNTDGFDLRLNSEPTSDVTISLTTTADFTVSPASLTFTSVNWRDYQQIIITAVDDSLLEGTEVIDLSFPSTGSPGYVGTFVGVDLTVVDNDAAITPDLGDGLSVAEGSLTSDSYTIALNDTPPSAVTVTVSSTQCEVSVNNIAFADTALITLNGMTPVSIFIRAVDDDVDEGTHTCTIEHAPTVSSDPSHNGMLIPDVTADVTDNDTSGYIVTENGGNTSIVEGGATDSFTVVLNSQPTASVTVMLTTDDDSTLAPTILTFTPANWDNTQTVTVTAVNDRIVEGIHSSSIELAFTSSDAQYNGLSDQVIATVTDNDSASVTFTDASGANLENTGTIVRTVVITYMTGGTGNFGLEAPLTVQLSTQNVSASNADYTLDVTSVTFGIEAADNATRNYSYTLINDNVAEDEEVFNVGLGTPTSASIPMLVNITASDTLPATILNDDTAGIVIEESGGSSSVTEGGSGDDYTVVLGTEPTGTVTLMFSTSQVTATPSVLTFTTVNWDIPQGVIIQAIDDLISEGAHTGTVTHTASGGGYSGATTITISINDNDSKEVIILPATVNVTEDGLTDTFTVVLTSQPTGAVSISMDGGTQATTNSDIVNFTTSNWDTPKTVTVTAIDDGLVEREHLGFIELTASGGGYDAVVIEDVDVNIIDNDAEGVIVTPFTITAVEGGTNGTYTIRLRTQPPNDVVVSLTGDSQIDLSVDEATFDAGNWDIPQTIAVTGVDDNTFEGAQSATITHAVTSADLNYQGIAVPDVTVGIVDGQTELLFNGGFEDQGATPEAADLWTGSKLVATKDQRLCNTIEVPNVAFEGDCAFQFSAAAGGSPVSRKLSQVMTLPVWGFKNDQLTLSAQVDGFKVKTGGKLTLQVVYTDNTKTNASITIPTGTHAYSLKTRTLTLTKRVKKVTVVLNMAKAGGRVYLDEVSLILSPKAFLNAPAAPVMLPLPPAP